MDYSRGTEQIRKMIELTGCILAPASTVTLPLCRSRNLILSRRAMLTTPSSLKGRPLGDRPDPMQRSFSPAGSHPQHYHHIRVERSSGAHVSPTELHQRARLTTPSTFKVWLALWREATGSSAASQANRVASAYHGTPAYFIVDVGNVFVVACLQDTTTGGQ